MSILNVRAQSLECYTGLREVYSHVCHFVPLAIFIVTASMEHSAFIYNPN